MTSSLDPERKTRIARAVHTLSDDSITRKNRIKALIADVRAEEAERIYAASTDNLFIVWGNVERACPPDWRHSVTPYYPDGWEAEAHNLKFEDKGRGPNGTGAFLADTPEAALHLLLAELVKREKG